MLKTCYWVISTGDFVIGGKERKLRWNSFWKLKVVKTCKLNFENQTCLVDFWEWSSKQLTCNLIFEFFFWIFGSGEQFVSPANWIRKSKLPYVALGMDLWSVNLQTEFQKIFLDIWKWWTVCNTSKLNFDKQNWLMDFWEWISEQLTWKLIFKTSFWISGSG